MRRAIQVARRNLMAPFGSMLVDAETGEIVAEGVSQTAENPIWHGEIDALNRFVDKCPEADWTRLRLYTTAEPCCMCQGAILWTGIPEVAYGTSIATLQRLGWGQIEISAGEVARRAPFSACKLIGSVLEDECDELFRSAPR